jgi:2,3-bisphosphoglycerate-dependent phosphoglycerate mutase
MLAQALIVRDGSILMLHEHVQRGDLVWNFPGGGVESGETPEQACIREVKEETGFDVIINHLLHVSEHKYTFIAQIIGGELDVDFDNPDNLDIVSAEWVPLDNEDHWDRVTLPVWEAYKRDAEQLKTIYVPRHCKAGGQEPDASLTEEGWEQVDQLRNFFSVYRLDQAVVSPFLRAQQTLRCLSVHENLAVTTDERLSERVLSGEQREDWLTCLQRTFDDPELCYPGGESSRTATMRILHVLETLLISENKTFVLCTHGNLISLLLRYYDLEFGFEQWNHLSNPDVYRLTFCKKSLQRMERIWK